MPWWSGKSLLETVNELKEPEKPTDLPLRLPIQEVYSIKGIGVVPVGKLETGKMKIGDKIVAVPGREGKGVTGEVKSVEMHHEQLQSAQAGDNVGFNVRGLEKKDIARGDVFGHTDDWPTVAEEFTAQIVVLEHPSVITIGYTPVFHIHTSQVACQFIEIVETKDPATGQTKDKNPDFIKKGDIAVVRLKPVQAVVLEPQSKIPEMSRFAIRDSGVTVAVGVCTEVKAKQMQ